MVQRSCRLEVLTGQLLPGSAAHLLIVGSISTTVDEQSVVGPLHIFSCHVLRLRDSQPQVLGTVCPRILCAHYMLWETIQLLYLVALFHDYGSLTYPVSSQLRAWPTLICLLAPVVLGVQAAMVCSQEHDKVQGVRVDIWDSSNGQRAPVFAVSQAYTALASAYLWFSHGSNQLGCYSLTTGFYVACNTHKQHALCFVCYVGHNVVVHATVCF